MTKKIAEKPILNHVPSGTDSFGLRSEPFRLAGYDAGKRAKVLFLLLHGNFLFVGRGCWIGRFFIAYGSEVVRIGNECVATDCACVMKDALDNIMAERVLVGLAKGSSHG